MFKDDKTGFGFDAPVQKRTVQKNTFNCGVEIFVTGYLMRYNKLFMMTKSAGNHSNIKSV